MACIIYYQNLDYDCLPTAKKRRLNIPNGAGSSQRIPLSSVEAPSRENTTNLSSNFIQSNDHRQSNSFTSDTVYSETNYPKKRSFAPTTNSNDNNSFNSTSGYQSSEKSFQSALDFQPDTRVNGGSGGFQSASRTYNNSSSNNRSGGTRRNVSQDIPSHDLLHETLKKYFNFETFRQNQLEAVDATCAGLDTLILMPTGGGKSICYQIPAIVSQGVTIVVSPLKSLIVDQVERLRSLYVKTSALFGDTPDDEVAGILQDLRQYKPTHKLLYVTPEKINASGALMSIFDQLYSNGMLARFVIDEAHCVSMWGADFRPDYRKLGKLRNLYPEVPIMALTATAPPKVRDDILDQLGMNKERSKIFIQSFNRPNLKFEVRDKGKGCLVEICNLIRANFKKKCGIIYCLSRADCDSLSEKLRENGVSCGSYHAGCPEEARKKVFSAWSRGKFQVVCATIAFGMGIDKSDVRFVIHYSVPKSLEGYYQEAGRAGRDGQFASCILYFSKTDLYRMRSMLNKGFGRKAEDKKRDQTNLQHMIDYVNDKTTCRRTIMLRYLGEEFDSSKCINNLATACDNCLKKRSD